MGAVADPIRQVALMNEGGQVVGGKPVGMLTKDDVVNTIFLLLVTPGRQMAVSVLPSQRFSATAVTVRAPGESPDDAAGRALAQAGIHTQLHHLGDQFCMIDSRKTYISVFYGVADVAAQNPSFVLWAVPDLEQQIGNCTTAFQYIWQAYRHLLPL